MARLSKDTGISYAFPHVGSILNTTLNAFLKTHYTNLKISEDAPAEVVKAAYRALSHRYHPDKNVGTDEANQIMRILNDAYATLSDPVRRRHYDQYLASERLAQERRPKPPPSSAETSPPVPPQSKSSDSEPPPSASVPPPMPETPPPTTGKVAKRASKKSLCEAGDHQL